MNIIERLRISYGDESIKEFRRLESLTRKRAHYRNHLRFNLRCRDEEVVPASLNIKNPIPTRNAEKVIRKVRMTLVKERIRCTTDKLKNINRELHRETETFKRRFPQNKEMEIAIHRHLVDIHEQEFTETKTRQIRKLDRLIAQKKKAEPEHAHINEKWIHNISRTPTGATIQIVQDKLKTDRTLKKRTNLTVQDITQLLQFIATSTYFQFRNTIYRQKEGFAMGDPLSAIMCGFFMEDLEQKALTTIPVEYRPTLWKRYVDDILEKVKRGHTQQLIDHLNTIDNTGNIKFTHEEETEQSIAFLDLKIHHTEEGDIKIKVHRKPTHTDQYLNWTSEHPIMHKISVVRTLHERAAIITDAQDKEQEEQHIQHALKACQYPQWAISKGEEQVKNNKTQKKEKKQTNKQEHRGVVTLPYIRGITERIQRAMRKYNINTPVKPHTTLRQILVHPKDRIHPDNRCNTIYEIPCQLCNKTYIGETGRSFNTRKNEHKECEKETATRQTRTIKEKAQQENYKSAITDHCKRENHVMDWGNARVIRTEDNKHQRWIREAIEIRKRSPRTINRDKGAYMLSHTWSAILQGTN
ncbi:uncharacterized protein LOC132873505 [Neoarius graeffei]|uniref:uncharacterized protein LOC132873505 n=1 Tax=Neoarius graeffei TaxID=443677 RepID=UPI00298C9C63|nr:uncharacterized protein LOC132873505 [Neoarius graeffei]